MAPILSAKAPSSAADSESPELPMFVLWLR
jgi:hypothetical protein